MPNKPEYFETLARQYFKERAGRREVDVGFFYVVLSGVIGVWTGGTFFGPFAGMLLLDSLDHLMGWLIGCGLVGGLVGGASPWLARAYRIRKQCKEDYTAYLAGDADAVAAVHRHALKLLRDRIRRQRERMLGSDSEWVRARAPLTEALGEAKGRIAYWQERGQDEPESEIASLQLGTAQRLHGKLKDALAEVDNRAAALSYFYHRCEAKLAAMDRSSNDLVEVRRLEQLSGKADAAMAHARGTIEGLAQSFLAEAQNIASALGSADRSQLGVLAGNAPIENIEYLADKIHESRERDRGAIEKLERTLAE